jgi:hypothetical protein
MLADYLRQQQQAEGLEDLGYFDDFVEEGDAEAPLEFDTPLAPEDLPAEEDMMGEDMTEEEAMAEEDAREQLKKELGGISDEDLDVYLRTGNLPVRRGRRGKGVLKIQHGGRRAESVMAAVGRPRTKPVQPVMFTPGKQNKDLFKPGSRFTPVVSRPGTNPVKAPAPPRRGQPVRGGGRRAERAAIVKQVMRERGVKLGEASRIVKEEGLY